MVKQQKKGGMVLKILKGQYEGKRAIAWRNKQEDQFIAQGKVCITVYEDDYKKEIAKNVLISIDNCKQIGFAD